MTLYLDDLTKSNDRPPDSTILVVKELISVPLRQLEDLKVELKRLEEKRVEIEESMRGYRRILAPIRRVPQDILRAIFEHCLPTHHNPTMAATESPVLLTRVCSSWRTVAMTSPRLWAQLHIPFRKEVAEENFCRGGGLPLVPLQMITSVLQDRCHAVHEWLSRSGDRPLSISVDYQQAYTLIPNSAGTEQIDNSAKALLNTLLIFSPRWRTLELNIPVSIYHELERMLSAHILPFLLRLRGAIYQNPYSRNATARMSLPLIMLLRAPNLKYVSLNCPKITDLLRPNTTIQLTPWNNGITHVSLSMCSLEDCIALLKRHPKLIRCNLLIGLNSWEADQQTIIPASIYLPHLLSLWINTCGNTVLNFAPTLYNVIHAPQLQSVGYYNNGGSYSEYLSVATDQIPPSFFYRATNLTKLEIDRFVLMPSNILDVFEAQHRLTDLALTCKYGIGPSKKSSSATDTFDLETLVAQVDVDESAPLMPPFRQLLPHLEVFELHRTIVSDDLVLRFVFSRMNPSSHIAVLKKVKIRFDRLKDQDGLDLADEIRVRADTACIQIDTNFHYALSTLQVKREQNFLSPSYILCYDADDRTWKHEDFFDKFDD